MGKNERWTFLLSEDIDAARSGSAAEKTLKAGGGEPMGKLSVSIPGTSEIQVNADNDKAYKAVVGDSDPSKGGKKVSEEEGEKELDTPRSGSDAEKTLHEESDEDDDKKEVKESDDKDEDDKEDLKEESDEDEDKKEVKEEDEKDDDKKEVDEEDEKEDEKVDVKEGVEAILKGEKLSPKFQKKVAVVFESFVNAKAKEIRKAYGKKLAAAEQKLAKILEDRVNKYVSYVAEEWMTENKLAVERGLQTEIVENFISGLKNLFEQHYVTVPASKVNLLDEIAAKLEKTQAALNEECKKSMKLQGQINESKKSNILAKLSAGLTVSQQEKLKKLAEGVEYKSDEQFAEKAKLLRESVFSKAPKADQAGLTEIVEGGLQNPGQKTALDVYSDVITRMVVK